jgi:hypothetical protein
LDSMLKVSKEILRHLLSTRKDSRRKIRRLKICRS